MLDSRKHAHFILLSVCAYAYDLKYLVHCIRASVGSCERLKTTRYPNNATRGTSLSSCRCGLSRTGGKTFLFSAVIIIIYRCYNRPRCDAIRSKSVWSNDAAVVFGDDFGDCSINRAGRKLRKNKRTAYIIRSLAACYNKMRV